MRQQFDDDFNEPVPVPIDGVLDLHTFRPREVKDVVLAYLDACQQEGILEVRVIHGKGIGNLQRTVHALLKEHPEVISFTLASQLYGGSGATIVKLRPRAGSDRAFEN
jgi:DNA-nicking Smr family endonuclease